MFTPKNQNKASNERGALMLEAIALLGLMTMMSPMIVRQTADRTAEMEEVTIAGQLKTIKDATSNWIRANYQEKAKEFALAGNSETNFTLSAGDLALYLPSSYIDSATNTIKGNKLVNGYDVGVNAQCSEAKDSAGECGSITNGVVSGLSATCKCTRYKMTGLVLSKNGTLNEIDDRRASRIASMVGADGGYVRTKKVIEALTGGDPATVEAEMKKVVGSQGVWEGNISKYISGADTTKGGRIAATTVFSSSLSGDYLYRKQVDGLPDANSMFTDLDMGGNGACASGTGCNAINNAGGLEVINGKILIRKNNTASGSDQDVDVAQIALATDASHIKSDNSVYLEAGTATSLNLTTSKAVLDSGSSTLTMNSSATDLTSGTVNFAATAGMNLTSVGMNLNSGTGAMNLAATGLNAKSTGAAKIESTGDMTLDSGNKTKISSSSDMLLNSGAGSLNFSGDSAVLNSTNIALNGSGNVNVATNKFDVDATSSVDIKGGNSSMSMNNSGTEIQSSSISLKDTAGAVLNLVNGTALLETPKGYLNMGEDVRLNANNDLYLNSNKFVNISGQNGVNANTTTTGASFALKPTYFQVNTSNTTTMPWMNLSQSGFEVSLGTGKGRMQFVTNTNNPTLELFSTGDVKTIGLDAEKGRVSASYFQPEKVQLANGAWVNPVQKTVSVSVAENGSLSAPSVSANDLNASVGISFKKFNIGTDSNPVYQAPYYTYNTDVDTNSASKDADEDDKYNRFRVDPAFVSVMNDIKLTSRGGARLSDSLPNYILKGIYVLSNTYGAGPWPCNGTNCKWSNPYFSNEELGLQSGGYEYNCEGADHPAEKGGGTCSESGVDKTTELSERNYKTTLKGTVTFNSYDGSYTDCPERTYCWAHPFLGTVPAPGRKVSDSSDSGTHNLYAQDEGVCPDGYQAVITVTPQSWDSGRVYGMIDQRKYEKTSTSPDDPYEYYDPDLRVKYNLGYSTTAGGTEDTHAQAGIGQAASRVAVSVETVLDGQDVDGWRVAMGTVIAADNADSYIWNAGGVEAGSMTALAHTYCYYNPGRFKMPNMEIKDNVLKSMNNPNLANMNN